jgi:hypothetical protein
MAMGSNGVLIIATVAMYLARSRGSNILRMVVVSFNPRVVHLSSSVHTIEACCPSLDIDSVVHGVLEIPLIYIRLACRKLVCRWVGLTRSRHLDVTLHITSLLSLQQGFIVILACLILLFCLSARFVTGLVRPAVGIYLESGVRA